MSTGEAEALTAPATLPQHRSIRATKSPVFFTHLRCLGLCSLPWLPGGRAPATWETRRGEGMPAPATPPSPAGRPAGEALSLVGFPPWCPGTCLTGLVWVEDPERKCFHRKQKKCKNLSVHSTLLPPSRKNGVQNNSDNNNDNNGEHRGS